uniref:Uncharacterized protein n=1 Tax=Canis lupus dingo TaxID=286419 RepID=A0A8C0JS28_CANLU
EPQADSPLSGETDCGLQVTFTIQHLMHVKEVGSIIRKKGESAKICGDSSARTNI